jgi:predicted regulator of Ras-like GTPase activity (Roadblock/LC7/MglB family)
MQTVLSQLNSVPGVVGSLICGLDGQLVAQVFPPIFDASALQDMSRTLADGATALDLSSDTTELLDFRFKEGRLLAKPFTGAMLAVVCTKATNVQFLTLSVTAAVAKLEKLRPTPPVAAAPARVTPAASAPAGDPRAKKVAAPSKGLDELRRRLAGAAAVQAPATPAGAEPRAKQAEAKDPSTPKLQWWEGMT